MSSVNNKRSRDESSDRILFEDPDFPMSDCDDNLLGEMSQDFIQQDDDLLDELSQDFMEASQFFEKLPLYYQVGSGFENRPGSSSEGPPYVENRPSLSSDDVEGAIILEERSRRQNKKYAGEEVVFRAHVDTERLPRHVLESPLVAVVECLRHLFVLLLTRCKEGLRPTDLMRVCINAAGLDKPISTTLMQTSALTVEKVLSAVMKVLQSKEEIRLDSEITVDVMTIRRDVGAARNKVINAQTASLVKRSILSIPSDEEGLCCAKAIVYALAHLHNDHTTINALRDRRRPTLMKRARELHQAAGVDLGPCTYAEIAIFEEYLDTQIVVISLENLNKVSYKGKDRAHRINLWLNNNHYDVIKSLKGFYGSHFYCEVCEKPYEHLQNHYCPNACPICQRVQCTPGDSTRCPDCDRLCRSQDCFNAHKVMPGNAQLSLCDRVYQCRQCCKIILRKACPKETHRCGTTKCPSCKQFVVAAEHRCFLRTVDAKPPLDSLIFFDFETDQSTGEHLVNFAVAQYASGSEKVFKGYTACTDFCAWLFASQHKGYTAIAHNMKGFDGQFVLGWLLEQGTTPEIIPCGGKIMSITHSSLDIRVIDSYNFLPMALCKLPACFGLEELKKGYFPHLFNTRENQFYVGPLPEPRFYSPDTMTTSARTAFLAWHEDHKMHNFVFQDEMLAYCRSDVDILRRCCLEFRTQFIQVAKVDPFRYVTIASACMATYRASHIQHNTIAMVPVRGYVNHTQYSPDSIRWLDYIAHTEGIFIQHALNGNGERKIGGISVDGYCSSTNTVYQYHGCFFHGCPTCYDRDIRNPLSCVTMAALYEKTQNTSSKLRSKGWTVVEEWEHNFLKEKTVNVNLKEFLTTHTLQDRLNPRDAFFGGRTNAVQLFYEGTAKYVDFTSLYPWVNKYCRYPVGHPTILTEGFGDLEQYFGIIKCKVVPPRGLYLPVLPYRCNGKLMFPLCRVCAKLQNQTVCQHTHEERSIMGTWITEEVKMAVQKGYRVTKIYEVYHFETSSDSLFRSYIDMFLKIKQESSGWPAGCDTPDQRAEYIQQYYEKEGVRLDPAVIAKNPGRRQVAKLALNSFWGRWGMNINKPHVDYIHSLPDFNKMLADTTKNIKDVYFPTDEIAAIHWDKSTDFVAQDTSTNIFLAAFTTAWARLKLYSEMDKLGRAVLYHDTDSIIFASDSINDPPLGNFLGEFTDELDGDVITTFVSGGPKNYAYQTAAGKTCCKVRGFTLNFRNSQLLNFNSIKSLVCDMEKDASIAIHNPSKITREAKRRKVINKMETKLYRLVYDKRVVKEDMTTLPYGY